MDLFFPKSCLNCQTQGYYLCLDCQALIEILERQFCPVCSKAALDGICLSCRNKTRLDGLYFAISYKNPIVKKLITHFKYQPFVKDLAETLSSLIISHFQLLNKKLPFLENGQKESYLIIPVPLHRKRLKWRGYNQSEELAKGLSSYYGIPILNNFLLRKNPALIRQEEKNENIKGTFVCRDFQTVRKKKILLVDDVFIAGSIMEECAGVLKKSGAKEVLAVAIAREE